MEAQDTIRRQEEQLREVQIAKKKLEEMEEERARLLRELEQSKMMENDERIKLVNIETVESVRPTRHK